MNNTTGGGAQNYSNLPEDYGRADTDQRHVFSTSVNWSLDYYSGKNDVLRHVLNGWSIAPIIRLRSGLPFTITNGNVDANLDGNTNDRAQVIGDPHIDHSTAAQWFNTAAFVQKIGRASCRERVWTAGVARSCRKKSRRRMTGVR